MMLLDLQSARELLSSFLPHRSSHGLYPSTHTLQAMHA